MAAERVKRAEKVSIPASDNNGPCEYQIHFSRSSFVPPKPTETRRGSQKEKQEKNPGIVLVQWFRQDEGGAVDWCH